MKTWAEHRKELMKNPEFVAEYQKLQPGYQLARAIIEARLKNDFTQSEIAERTGLKQAAVARLESGTANPTVATMQKIATGLGKRLVIELK